MTEAMEERLGKKSGEQRLLRLLIDDYKMASRLAEAAVQDAQACLLGQGGVVGVGQVRAYLARQQESAGRAIQEMGLVEVIWTVDSGREDAAVKKAFGVAALRQVRILRLLDEALEQGAVATQEDLARVLQTSVRTIKRDYAQLAARGQWLASRGTLQGMGRGQSHKGQIIARWLGGESYDQLRLSTRHVVISIQRYITSFVRVVDLHQRGNSVEVIAFLLQISQRLVSDYLAIYQAQDSPLCRARLQEQLARLQQAGEKGAR